MSKNNTPYTEETIVKVNDIHLAYDAFGDPSAPALLLIMGLGAQMVVWDAAFCALLAEGGFRVIRFDNRDVGHSTRFDQYGVPDIPALMMARAQGIPSEISAPYTLKDMADDAVGLLSKLGYESAHVVGASLGGMIAQLVALHYPKQVHTLTSIMSMTGDLNQYNPAPEALSTLLALPPPDREGYVNHSLNAAQVVRGSRFPFDEARARRRVEEIYDRGLSPGASARQVVALAASTGWRQSLPNLQTPTLVIHGDMDPIIPVEGGMDTAKMIPDAELLVIEGLGHELPPGVWPEMADAIIRHAQTH